MVLLNVALKVFNEETVKFGGSEINLSEPFSLNEQMLSRVVSFCENKNYNLERFIRSRFYALNNWSKEVLRYKTLPVTMLINPEPDSIYENYVSILKTRYGHNPIPCFINLVDKLRLENSSYEAKIYKLQTKDFLNYRNFLSDEFIATDKKFIDLVKNGVILSEQVPDKIKNIWKNKERYLQLKVLRKLVCTD